MNLRVLFFPVFVLTVAMASEAGDAKKDSARLQGKWSRDYEGFKVELTFEGDKFTINIGGMAGKGTFTLDPSKSPGHIDMKLAEFDKKDYVGKTALGIYAFDGGSLKWCSNEPGKDARPKEFPKSEEDAKKNTQHLYVILKKAK